MDYLIQIYKICNKYPSYNTKNHSLNMIFVRYFCTFNICSLNDGRNLKTAQQITYWFITNMISIFNEIENLKSSEIIKTKLQRVSKIIYWYKIDWMVLRCTKKFKA